MVVSIGRSKDLEKGFVSLGHEKREGEVPLLVRERIGMEIAQFNEKKGLNWMSFEDDGEMQNVKERC